MKDYKMAHVTDENIYFEDKLLKKIDLIIHRLTRPQPKKDALLLVEGAEGEGKTTLSFQIARYVSEKTGRPFSNANVFFNADKLLKFAQQTEGQIIIYDEPSLDMMSSEWWKQEQINIVKLLMTARFKRHFFIFNITKFYKFNEYVVVDRSIGLIHVYSRHEVEAGRLVYIKKKMVEYLFNSYRQSKRRDYQKYKSFGGTFQPYIPKCIDEEEYNKAKLEAIDGIGGVKAMNKDRQELLKLKYKIGNLRCLPITERQQLADALDISYETLRRWATESEEMLERAGVSVSQGTPHELKQPMVVKPNKAKNELISP